MVSRFRWILASVVLAVWSALSVGAEPLVLTLLHVNDVHGRVHVEEKAAGLAKLAPLVAEVREQMPHVLLLDGGDTISGQPETILTGGEGVVAAMNAMRFDAMAVGNHEFDRGHEVAERVLAAAEFDVLTANVTHRSTGKLWPVATPYVVKEIGGARIALFGLTTPDTMRFQYPRGMGDYEVTDFIAVAREIVPVLRERERADVVVAVTHLGVKDDRKLATEVGGIDVILGGHSHTTLEEQVRVGQTLIMQCGAHGVALGRADLLLEPDADGGFRIAGVNGKDGKWWGHDGVPAPRVSGADVVFPTQMLHRPAASTEDDPAVATAYASYRTQTDAYLAEVLAEAGELISGEGAKERESPLGNLLADAIRAHTHADVAVYASSQFKPITLERGPITMADLYRVMSAYTRQHIVPVRARGEHVRAMLASAIATPGKQPLHVSGARVTPDAITLDNGSPLEDEKVYTVAGAAHVMQEQLIGKPSVEVVFDDPAGLNCRDALAAYLRGLGTVTPPATDRTRKASDTAALAEEPSR